MYAADEYLAADDEAFGPFADDDYDACLAHGTRYMARYVGDGWLCEACENA